MVSLGVIVRFLQVLLRYSGPKVVVAGQEGWLRHVHLHSPTKLCLAVALALQGHVMQVVLYERQSAKTTSYSVLQADLEHMVHLLYMEM